jgi:hypothetical protein
MFYFKRQKKIHSVIAFLGIFFAIFGPKVFGVIDLMVLVPFFLLLLFLGLHNGNLNILRVDKIFSVVMIQSFFIIVFICFTFLINDAQDTYFTLRSLRSMMSSFLLFLLFFSLIKYGLLETERFIKILIFVLFIGALVVLVQSFVPTTQQWFSDLWGFTKPHRFLRAFGMTAGYDTMGYLLVFGACAALGRYLQTKEKLSLFYFIFIGGSILFTSRTSMLLLLGTSALTFLLQAKKLRLLSLQSAVFYILIFGISYFIIFPVIYNTIILQNSDAELFGFVLSERFAVSDIGDTVDNHFLLPDNFSELLFGSGVDKAVDPGYMKIIFYGGFTLLSFYILFYLSLYLLALSKAKSIKHYFVTFGNPRNNEDLKKILFVLFLIKLILLITMIGNLKNLYFLTRGYHELLIVLLAVFLGSCSRLREITVVNSERCLGR